MQCCGQIPYNCTLNFSSVSNNATSYHVTCHHKVKTKLSNITSNYDKYKISWKSQISSR